MRKLIVVTLMFLTSHLYGQDDFSLTFNPFNTTEVDSNSYWIGDDYYADVPSVFYVYDYNTSNYILLEGLVIYRRYFNTECPEETYWDIDEFTNNYYKPFDQSYLYIFGFKIFTQWQVQPSQTR
jgi:hypothetical protein